MKISQMLEREDFYTINKRTLEKYWLEQVNDAEKTNLYIYPHLNAIVTSAPTKEILEYLLCEYSIRSSIIKRLLIKLYVYISLKSKGILASKMLAINAHIENDMLIYPCNKKYRIFNFKRKTVSVIVKDGFSDSDLRHEIAFRSREDLPSFVPEFVCSDEHSYEETIIDGRPLARISDGFEEYRNQAYKLLKQYGDSQTETRNANEYARILADNIYQLLEYKAHNKEIVNEIVERLLEVIPDSREVQLTFSHGDLQPGNIWVENKNDHIYIIDWESWGIRSEWYDYDILYHNLRPDGLSKYFSIYVPEMRRAIVLLEDLIFQLKELNSLPKDFGQENFEAYCNQLQENLTAKEEKNNETV